MASHEPNAPNTAASVIPSAPNDLPPPYSAVVGTPSYGFVAPPNADNNYPMDQQPKFFTAPGVYPHPPSVSISQPTTSEIPQGATVPVGVVIPMQVGSEPATVTCYNCGKVVTTRVTYTTAWHTHLVAGSVCIITMACSLCCLGLIPYCFDSFKDAEHYCPNCSAFIGKSNKC